MVAQNRLLGDSGITGGSLETDGIQALGSLYRSRLAGEPLSYISKYGVKGVSPTLVTNFLDGEYLLGGVESTFTEAFTGTSPKLTYSTTNNSTMVNSAGNIVWAPHNLVTYSEDFSQWADHVGLTLDSSTTTDPLGGSTAYTYSGFSGAANNRLSQIFSLAVGVSSTLAIWLKGTAGETIELELDTNGAPENTITFTGDWQLETISNSNPTTGRVRVIYRTGNTADVVSVWGAHVYRSDLGGMAQVPQSATGFETYVPTSGSAEYLPRVGHHVYNGSAWVNEGLLIESEARTNLVTYSEDFTDAAWQKSRGTAVLDAVGPDGLSNSAATFTVDTVGGVNNIYVGEDFTVSTSTSYTFSIFAKADQTSDIQIRIIGFTTPAEGGVFFDLSAGTVGNDSGAGGPSLTGKIEDFGNGWHRCSVTFTTDATDTTGTIRVFLADGESLSITRDGTSSVLIYGAQLEAAPTPSSYMPTSGGTYTRTAQSLEVPPAQFGWPEPEYIGPDLVVEGNHTAIGSDWSYASGTYSSSGSQTSGGNLVQFNGIGTSGGKVYSVSFDIANRTGGSLGVRLNTGSSSSFNTNGTHTVTLTGTSTDGFQLIEQSSFDGDVSNVSVREINPLSVSIQMDGRMTYADEDGAPEHVFYRQQIDGNNRIEADLWAAGTSGTGEVVLFQRNGGLPSTTVEGGNNTLSPGILTPFSISSRHGSTFYNLAHDGVALTEDTTPTALPDLSGTNLQIAYGFMGTIGTFRQFAGDIGDAGLETSSDPGPSLSLTFDGSSTSSFVIN